MSKKAFLVTYEVTIRVVADEFADEEAINVRAIDKVGKYGLEEFFNCDNMVNVCEDTEIPYVESKGDKFNVGDSVRALRDDPYGCFKHPMTVVRVLHNGDLIGNGETYVGELPYYSVKGYGGTIFGFVESQLEKA